MPAVRAVARHVEAGHAELAHVAERHRLVVDPLCHRWIVLPMADGPQDELVARGCASITPLDGQGIKLAGEPSVCE
jgi:hypothetical protein